ncbi:hypothetical protein MAP00_001745 [Monascus purpureus]|nr:hypothetical protein MAP00_001745 [Monascus purpureus]
MAFRGTRRQGPAQLEAQDPGKNGTSQNASPQMTEIEGHVEELVDEVRAAARQPLGATENTPAPDSNAARPDDSDDAGEDLDALIQAEERRLERLAKEVKLADLRRRTAAAEANIAGARIGLNHTAIDQVSLETRSVASQDYQIDPANPDLQVLPINRQPLPPQASLVPGEITRTVHVDDRTPPNPVNMAIFTGKTIGEYNDFINQLEAHFNKYEHYYSVEKRKVALAVSYLHKSVLYHWVEYTHGWAIQRSWKEFLEFCLHWINDHRNLQKDAAQKFFDARQLEHQSVRDFAAYLAIWERQMKTQLSEELRQEYLRTRVLPRIRSEALKYPQEPETYEAYVSYLQTIEDQLPGRKLAQQPAGKARMGRPNSRTHTVEGTDNMGPTPKRGAHKRNYDSYLENKRRGSKPWWQWNDEENKEPQPRDSVGAGADSSKN